MMAAKPRVRWEKVGREDLAGKLVKLHNGKLFRCESGDGCTYGTGALGDPRYRSITGRYDGETAQSYVSRSQVDKFANDSPEPLQDVQVGDLVMTGVYVDGSYRGDTRKLWKVTKRTSARVFCGSMEWHLSGRGVGSSSHARIPTEQDIAEIEAREAAKKKADEEYRKKRQQIESQSGYAESQQIINATACEDAESLLKAYGPARIIAAWKALNER